MHDLLMQYVMAVLVMMHFCAAPWGPNSRASFPRGAGSRCWTQSRALRQARNAPASPYARQCMVVGRCVTHHRGNTHYLEYLYRCNHDLLHIVYGRSGRSFCRTQYLPHAQPSLKRPACREYTDNAMCASADAVHTQCTHSSGTRSFHLPEHEHCG